MLNSDSFGVSSSSHSFNNSFTDFNKIGCIKSAAISLSGYKTKFLRCNL